MKNILQIPEHLIPSDPRFASGPTRIPKSHIQNMINESPAFLGMSHRHNLVVSCIKETQELVKEYLDVPKDYEVVFGNGGATFLFDVIGLCLTKKQVHHFPCGEFGQKWHKASKNIPWIGSSADFTEMGQGVTPQGVEKADVICATLNETSTGVMIDTFEKLKGYNGLKVFDGTSGLGQVPVDWEEVDCCFASLQKVFASDGGLWMMICSPKFMSRAREIEAQKNRYIPEIMKLSYYFDNALKGQTYTTPALATFYLFREQLRDLCQSGFQKVHNESLVKSGLVYDWALKKDYLNPFVSEARYRSCCVATIDVDSAVNVKEITSALDRDGHVYGIDSYRKLGRNQFRIGLFPAISLEDTERLLALLTYIIEEN